MKNYKLDHIDLGKDRTELHDLLSLTGAEISCNTLPAGASVPFVHFHKKNEEVYIVLDGKGFLYIDGEELPIAQGNCFRIDPKGRRCITAAKDSPLHFLCIQTKAGSLEEFTMNDGVGDQEGKKPSWL